MSTDYIGSTLSLISKSDIRYEGKLIAVDADKKTVTLANVRSFGTEGRRKTGKEIPVSSEVYDYIIFRSSDIKDLQVNEAPTTPKPQPASMLPNDPAVVSTQSNWMQYNAYLQYQHYMQYMQQMQRLQQMQQHNPMMAPQIQQQMQRIQQQFFQQQQAMFQQQQQQLNNPPTTQPPLVPQFQQGQGSMFNPFQSPVQPQQQQMPSLFPQQQQQAATSAPLPEVNITPSAAPRTTSRLAELRGNAPIKPAPAFELKPEPKQPEPKPAPKQQEPAATVPKKTVPATQVTKPQPKTKQTVAKPVTKKPVAAPVAKKQAAKPKKQEAPKPEPVAEQKPLSYADAARASTRKAPTKKSIVSKPVSSQPRVVRAIPGQQQRPTRHRVRRRRPHSQQQGPQSQLQQAQASQQQPKQTAQSQSTGHDLHRQQPRYAGQQSARYHARRLNEPIKKPEQHDLDFDFEQSNAKFDKDEVMKAIEAAAPAPEPSEVEESNADKDNKELEEDGDYDVTNHVPDSGTFYDSSKSFFDDISRDTEVRLPFNEYRRRRTEQHLLDAETFGTSEVLRIERARETANRNNLRYGSNRRPGNAPRRRTSNYSPRTPTRSYRSKRRPVNTIQQPAKF